MFKEEFKYAVGADVGANAVFAALNVVSADFLNPFRRRVLVKQDEKIYNRFMVYKPGGYEGDAFFDFDGLCPIMFCDIYCR